MSLIHRRLLPVRMRQQLLWLVDCAAWGLLVGAAGAVVYGLSQILLGRTTLAVLSLGLMMAGTVIGCLAALIRRSDFHQAAAAVDSHYGLKDRAATALAFAEKRDANQIHQLALADAEQHLSRVNAKEVAPWRTPRPIPWALGLTLLALGLLAVSLPSTPVNAALVVNDVVLAQAERAADQIEMLRKENEEGQDPELEQLIEKLAAKVEEMKQPGVDAKEALAKLSEMQAAVLEKQQQLENASAEVALQAVGDALSMAGSMSAAGSAMAAGNYAKASEELDKIDSIPELDRQTNRTVTEKLDEAKGAMAKGKLGKLEEAVENLKQGLGSGDGSAFGEGVRGLSGESKKQGKRKKLKDLLRKQNQALEESKSEVEGEAEYRGDGGGKGGSDWGTGRSGNEAGDKTTSLGSPKELKLQGQEGDQGDVDSETSHSPERREQARRGYRERFEQSQKLNDSVLDNEPIPLGHRQTIRRYFELIRPQQTEVDKVKEKTDGQAEETSDK